VVAAVVGIAGLAVCVALYRRGRDIEGVALCGVTALLVSPVSWVYHWVWLVPVLVVLLRVRTRGRMVVAVLVGVVLVIHPYTWIGGFSAVPSALFGGSQGWWRSWTSFYVVPHDIGGQLLSDSLVLVGLLLLAAGALYSGRAATRLKAVSVGTTRESS
jgi:hypothetical protein